MSKVAVVYWSSTGNTEAMANAVAEGAKAAGAEVISFESADFSADKVDEFDAIAFGCPAMGDEVLEEDEFEPMFNSCETKLSGYQFRSLRKGPQSGQRHLCAGKSSVRKHYTRTCIRYYESGNLCIWRRGSISKDGRVDQRRI